MCPMERIYWITKYINGGGKGHLPSEINAFLLKHSNLLIDSELIRDYIYSIHIEHHHWKPKNAKK